MKPTTKTQHSWLVWIDHRKAILLHADEEGHMVHEEMTSGLGEQERYRGEGTDKSAAFFGKGFDRQSHDQAREQEHYNAFLRRVVDHMNNPEAVHILGPGQARFALQQMLESDKSLKNISLTNTEAAQMTLPMLRAAFEEV